MKAIERRLQKLEGGGEVTWVALAVPPGCSTAQSDGKRLAEAMGYREPMLVIPFKRAGETEPRVIGVGLDAVIGAMNEIAALGLQRRIERQRERAKGMPLGSKK